MPLWLVCQREILFVIRGHRSHVGNSAVFHLINWLLVNDLTYNIWEERSRPPAPISVGSGSENQVQSRNLAEPMTNASVKTGMKRAKAGRAVGVNGRVTFIRCICKRTFGRSFCVSAPTMTLSWF